MFLDASAMVAILARESDANALAKRLGQARKIYTSPIAVYEAVLGLARLGNAPIPGVRALLGRFLDELAVEIVPITTEIGDIAIEAFARFGKGKHPAGLNLGDCFAYACSRSLDVPLLFKGEDFAQTDVIVG